MQILLYATLTTSRLHLCQLLENFVSLFLIY